MRKLIGHLVTLWHFAVLFMGGIIVKGSIKNPRLVMLLNRIVIIIFITYTLYGYINYGR